MKKILPILFIYIFYLNVFNSIVLGCTSFTASDNDMVLAACNEDWVNPKTKAYFFPAEEGKFGRMYIGHSEFPLYPEQQGLNDQGLFFDVFGTPYLKIEEGEGKPKIKESIKYQWMWYCSTVDEAIDLFNNYDWRGTGLEYGQYFIADRFGNSAIIEGDKIIYKTGDFQVVTNFLHSHPENGGYPCWRYEKAIRMLENMNNFSLDYFRDICDSTHQEGYYPTDYSLVCDLKNCIIHVYPYHNYENKFIINLNEELEKGEHQITINSLFEPENNHPPSKPIIEGSTSGKINNKYSYTANSNDPDMDDLFYLFDWGDGNNSGWFRSDLGKTSYSWSSSGIFEVKVKACDHYGRESEWSDPLMVTMPKTKSSFNNPILRFLEQHPHLFPILRHLFGL